MLKVGKQLKAWQASLGKVRFKRAYSAAGWTSDEVESCFRALKNERLTSGKCRAQLVENTQTDEPKEKFGNGWVRVRATRLQIVAGQAVSGSAAGPFTSAPVPAPDGVSWVPAPVK